MRAANDAPVSPLPGVPGHLTDAEEWSLYNTAQLLDPSAVIVELGVEYGRSTALLCKAERGLVISIDLFPHNHHAVGDLLLAHRSNLIEAGFADARYTTFRADSAQAALYLAVSPSLLFVDADHSYDAGKRDIEAWAHRVKVGGFVAFHDCVLESGVARHPSHWGVSRAVDEWLLSVYDEWLEERQVDTLRTFRRLA